MRLKEAKLDGILDHLLHPLSGASGAQTELSFHHLATDINSGKVVPSNELLLHPTKSEWCEFGLHLSLAREADLTPSHPKGNKVV